MLAAMKGHSRTIKTLVRLGAKVDVLGKVQKSNQMKTVVVYHES